MTTVLYGSHLIGRQIPDSALQAAFVGEAFAACHDFRRLEEKLNMPQKFDPITLEILWRRLISIVDEADASVARTAFSSLLRDAHDYTCMFTDSRGNELVQGTFCTPGQAGAMALGVKKIIHAFPR